MVRDATEGEKQIGMTQPRVSRPGREPKLYDVGGLGKITESTQLPDGRFVVNLLGVTRFRLEKELPKGNKLYRSARVTYKKYAYDTKEPEFPFDHDQLLAHLEAYLELRRITIDWEGLKKLSTAHMINILCQSLPFPTPEKQALLEARTTQIRGEKLQTLLQIENAPPMGGPHDPGPVNVN